MTVEELQKAEELCRPGGQYRLNVSSDGSELHWYVPEAMGQGPCNKCGWGRYGGSKAITPGAQAGTYRLVLTSTQATLTLMDSQGNVITTWNGYGTESGITGTWTGTWTSS